MTETAKFLTPSFYYGFTIFSDDRREEVGGKISYIGVYNGLMLFPHEQVFPLMLPRLALEARVYAPIDAKLAAVEIAVHFPGDKEDEPTFRQAFPIGARTNIVPDADPSELRSMFSAPLMFSPAPLKSTGKIQVSANIAGEIVRLGSLFIRIHPPVQASAT